MIDITRDEYDLLDDRTGEYRVTYSSGNVRYFKNRKKHRIDGPAVMFRDGDQMWFVNGYHAGSNKEFQEAAGISDEDMFMLILKYGDVTG